MEEYDEDEIGALDHEELEGSIQPDSKRLNALAEEFIESQQVQEWVLKNWLTWWQLSDGHCMILTGAVCSTQGHNATHWILAGFSVRYEIGVCSTLSRWH